MTDLILKWLQIAAILVAGAWAYYQFFLSGSNDWMINLELVTEVIPYGKDMRLMVVHVKSKNSRNTELSFDKHDGEFVLEVRQVPSGRKANSLITPEAGELIATYDLMPKDGYVFLPNAEFDDMVGVVLPANSMVALKARLVVADDQVSTDKIVRVR